MIPAQADQEPVQAISQYQFDPGDIISDAVFYDTSSMTEEQIRDFIGAMAAGCTDPYCLTNIRVTTQDQPADAYCGDYRGGVLEDAAAILSKVSTACGISPQVMLVTLQKESGLLTRTDVVASSYDAAFGWHCPDTGPGGSANCDPAYAGFFNQSYGMAKQWARYRTDPGRYNYRAGQTANILWNVAESGCGSAPVTIANTATASLYNYTPYQPNTAALASYPGPGDSCSAYGNRNFSFLFQKYFGSTHRDAAGTGSAVGRIANPINAGDGPVAVPIPDGPNVPAELAGQTVTTSTPAVAAGLRAGFAAIGLPYVWGGGGSGAGPSNGCGRGGGDFNSCGAEIGFDCSGLTAYVLGQAGYPIPDNSGTQRSAGVRVGWNEALPGDIVGFPGHVAVYLGTFGGRPYILEASWVGTPIHITPLTRTDVDPHVYRYWTGVPSIAPMAVDFSTLIRGGIVAAPDKRLSEGRSSGGSGRATSWPAPASGSGSTPSTAPRNWFGPAAVGEASGVGSIVPPSPAPAAVVPPAEPAGVSPSTPVTPSAGEPSTAPIQAPAGTEPDTDPSAGVGPGTDASGGSQAGPGQVGETEMAPIETETAPIETETAPGETETAHSEPETAPGESGSGVIEAGADSGTEAASPPAEPGDTASVGSRDSSDPDPGADSSVDLASQADPDPQRESPEPTRAPAPPVESRPVMEATQPTRDAEDPNVVDSASAADGPPPAEVASSSADEDGPTGDSSTGEL